MFARNALLARRLMFTVGSGFALALLLIAALTALGVQQLEETNQRLEAIVHNNSAKSRLATQMRDILRDRAISMLAIVVINDPFEKDQEMLRFYGYGSAYQKVRLELESHIDRPREKAALMRIDGLTRLNQPIMVHTVNLAVEGYTFLAFESLQREGIPLQRQLVTELDALVQYQRELTQTAADEARANYRKTRDLMLLLGILAVLVAGLVAWAVVRRTSRLAAASEREGTKFQTLFETNTDGIVIMDERGFIDCNQATLDMFHMTAKAQFLTTRPEHLGDHAQPNGSLAEQLAGEHLRMAMDTGHTAFEWVARRPDGSTFPSHISLHAMTLDGRTVIQAIMRDVSVQKETEENLTRARDAALSATQMKSQFVANVSHEIRTPMNGILGMTQLLAATPLQPRQKDYVEAIAGSAQALMAVINDLLDFSKIEAGRLSLEMISFDLAGLLHEIVAFNRPRAEAKGLHLVLAQAASVPAWVRGDPLRIRQILLNLLDNALKFTLNGEIRLQIDRSAQSAHHLRFRVTDTGAGMAPEVQARIFNAFAQGDGSVTRKFGGTGLGLTICRQLATLMGGELNVSSMPGSGSTFELTLPLPDALPVNHHATTAHPSEQFPGARVLVVEDNPVNQKLMRYMLENLGVEVQIAADGKAAYAQLTASETRTWNPHLVFMDIQMPEWDGLTTTRELRIWEKNHQAPPRIILALTANAMTGFDETCRQAGMDAVLTKPLQEEGLIAALTRWLPHRLADEGAAPASVTPQEPAIAPTASLFQPEKITEICRGHRAQIEEMLRLFIDTTHTQLTELRQAVAHDDALRAARQAHQIKGAGAFMGAEELLRLASQAEMLAKANDLSGCARCVDALYAHFQLLREEIAVRLAA